MVPARQILHSFVTDALRLSGEAMEYVKQLTEQADKECVSPALVRSFYQILHTLKGTATMIPEGQPIVQALHALEGKLACQAVTVSAQKLDWLDEAHLAMQRTQSILVDLQRKDRLLRIVPEESPGNAKGFLVRSRPDEAAPEGGELFWYPVEQVQRVFSGDELGRREVVCIQGAWVPVLGVLEAGASSSFGLCLRMGEGHAVLRVMEIRAVMTRKEAMDQGAREGLALFAEPAKKPVHPKTSAA